MEENRLLYIVAIIVAVLLLLAGGGFFFFVTHLPKSAPTPIINQTATTTPTAVLPTANDSANGGNNTVNQLEKEKQFISAYYHPINLSYTAKSVGYTLPIKDIKTSVINYRDVSRKLSLDNALPKLAANGFILLTNPFNPTIADWDGGYRTLGAAGLPTLITADSIIGLYQTTLQVIYKETEQGTFYPSLWTLLNQLAAQSQQRYEARHRVVGVQNDIIAEANRLEFGYVTVALKLLEPEQNQVKATLDTESGFFSPQEAANYKITVPDYLADQVAAELKLITAKTKQAKSPLLLYNKTYSQYAIPENYQASEKLKNYYLAITWLNDALFPLWSKSNDCVSCLLDGDDHAINFAAALYISHDLSINQDLKNHWATIYKTISFFKGLEANLTYLDYQQALQDTIGKDYNLDALFSASQTEVGQTIATLQQKLATYHFLSVLSGNPDTKDHLGLRLLRDRHVLEDKIFSQMIGSNVGNYSGDITSKIPLPFTSCSISKNISRCLPLSLDLFTVVKNPLAEKILSDSGNDNFAHYQKNIADFRAQLKAFNQSTWHDNAYLSLLASLQTMYDRTKPGFPAFMATTAYSQKSLATNLSSWVDFHRDTNITKTNTHDTTGLAPYLGYGYVEPQPELYAQLLANINMVSDGFGALQLITPVGKSYDRLKNLKDILNRALLISQAELEQKPLATDDYNFINNFNKYIRGVVGDVKPESLQNRLTVTFNGTSNNQGVVEQIDGFKYMMVIYPDAAGKLFFAIGPVLNYTEKNKQGKIFSTWQNDIMP